MLLNISIVCPDSASAYLLPLLQRQALLVPRGAQRGVRHLVLVPTAELAEQVTEVASRYGSGITHALQASRHSLNVPPGVDILVTTPGISSTGK